MRRKGKAAATTSNQMSMALKPGRGSPRKQFLSARGDRDYAPLFGADNRSVSQGYDTLELTQLFNALTAEAAVLNAAPGRQ